MHSLITNNQKHLNLLSLSLCNVSVAKTHRSFLRNLEKNNTLMMVSEALQGKFNHNSKVQNVALLKDTHYVTSEKYHGLNKDFSSHKSIKNSTSTLFYDLDQIAKSHSYHCISDARSSKTKQRNLGNNENKTAFKSEAIVQECETNIQPVLKTRDSMDIDNNKLKKRRARNLNLDSDMFLKDNSIGSDQEYFPTKEINSHEQKLWSYAKYRTEYTNPLPSNKKCKKKECAKRTEDPCPCQLFSYACPCTDKKSLTELARNSKSLTVVDQMTSTTIESCNHKNNKQKKTSNLPQNNIKTTSINNIEISKKNLTYDNMIEDMIEQYDIPTLTDNGSLLKNKRLRSKANRNQKNIICPNCKEKIDLLSLTEENDSIKSKQSPLHHITNEVFSSAEKEQIWSKEQRNDSIDDDSCVHSPPCELVPVCQILPSENEHSHIKSIKPQQIEQWSQPKNIRITKACRHHPPCTVVPSCQKLNVLKNNCEFIPPCLHRPRCINIPLCVPISKTLDYKLLHKQPDNASNLEYLHVSPCKYCPVYHHDSLNVIESEFHELHNTCEYLSEYTPRFIVNSKLPYLSQSLSPWQVTKSISCKCCKSNKSCQFNCVDCKCILPQIVKGSASSDEIIYIRDVGCQFRNKQGSYGNSLEHSRLSRASFNIVDKKVDNHYPKFQAPRYEDKSTNPNFGEEEQSMSTASTNSIDIDIHCPSHGKKAYSYQKTPTMGFIPQPSVSPFVGVLTAYANTPLQTCLDAQILNNICLKNVENGITCSSEKSQRSILRKKYKKVLSSRRRKKVKSSSHVFHTTKNHSQLQNS